MTRRAALCLVVLLGSWGCGKEPDGPPGPLPPAETRGLGVRGAPAAGRTDYRRTFAVIVGIDRYAGGAPGLPPLLHAVNDARAVRDLLRDEFGYREEDLRYLVDADATAEAVRASFDTLPSLTGDDAVLFFFSGHGLISEVDREGFLAAVDSDSRRLEETCIPVSWIRDRLERLPCRHRLVILDSCYSGTLFREEQPAAEPTTVAPGAQGTRGRPGGPSSAAGDNLAYYFKEPAFWGISAGRYTPVADGLGEDRHSVFTAALLQVMRERADSPRPDHAFTFRQVAALVETRVANALRSAQIPDWGKLGPGGGDHVFRPTVRRPTPTEQREREAAGRLKAQAREREQAGELLEAALLYSEANARWEDTAARCNLLSLLRRLGGIRAVVPLPGAPLPLCIESGGRGATVGLSTGELAIVTEAGEVRLLRVGEGPVIADRSADGRWIAAGAKEPSLLLRAADGSSERVLELTDRAIRVRFSPGGDRLLVAARDGAITLWDVETGRRLAMRPGEGDGVLSLRLVEYSRDGSRILVGGYQTLSSLDRDLGKVLAEVHMRGIPVTAIARNSDGRRVFIGAGRTAACIDLDGGRPTRTVLDDPQQITAIFQTESSVWLAKADGAVRRYSPADLSPVGPTLRFPGCVMDLDLDGETGSMAVAVSTGDEGAIYFVDPPVPEPPSLLVATGTRPHRDAMLFDDGRRIVLEREDRSSLVFDLPDGEPVALPGTVHAGEGARVAVFLKSRNVRIWDAAAGFWAGEEIPSSTMKVSGRTLLTATAHGEIRRWSLATGEPEGDPVQAPPPFSMFDIDPEAGVLLAVGESRATLLDAASGAVLVSRELPADAVAGVFTPGGRLIRVLRRDMGVLALDPRTLEPAPFQDRLDANGSHGWTHPELSVAGDVAAVRSGERLECWDLGSGRMLGEPIALDPAWRHFDLSPDGSTLYLETNGPTFQLFDARTGKPRAPPVPAPVTLYSHAFTPDGRILALPWKDARENVRFYDLETGEELSLRLDFANDVGGVNASLSFFAKGRRLLASRTSHDPAEEGWAVWDTSLLTDRTGPDALRDRARRATGLRLSEDGTSVVPIPPREWR